MQWEKYKWRFHGMNRAQTVDRMSEWVCLAGWLSVGEACYSFSLHGLFILHVLFMSTAIFYTIRSCLQIPMISIVFLGDFFSFQNVYFIIIDAILLWSTEPVIKIPILFFFSFFHSFHFSNYAQVFHRNL